MPVLIHGKVRLECEFEDITLNLAAKITEENFPDIWKYVFAKQFNPPPGYPSYKAPATAFSTAIIDYINRGTIGTAVNMGMAAPVLEKFNWPTYYISDQLLTALRHTNPPSEKTWNELTYPFPAITFVLPDKALNEPETGKNVRFVGFTKVDKNIRSVTVAGRTFRITNWKTDEDRIVIYWAVDNCLTIQDCTFPISQKLIPSADWINLQTESYTELAIQNQSYEAPPPASFSAYLGGLIANFILTMTARPSWVEKAEPISRKPLKSGVCLYQPTFIGRKYQIKYDQRPTPTGAHFTELRWRAGHWKTQHYGPGNTHTKEILIEPYMAYSAGLVRPSAGNENQTSSAAG